MTKELCGPAGTEGYHQFQRRLINRLEMPERHIIVCEDDLNNQRMIAGHFAHIFDAQGRIQVSYVSSGLAAAGILRAMVTHLIILDHDMPDGNGSDLIAWMKDFGYDIPIITFSGIGHNNEILKSLGAQHLFSKNDVLSGLADAVIEDLLK